MTAVNVILPLLVVYIGDHLLLLVWCHKAYHWFLIVVGVDGVDHLLYDHCLTTTRDDRACILRLVGVVLI